MQTIISFILMFGLLIFVHEFGHLIFAKRAGILCREFAIGMGPKIISWTRNETLYTLRLLPIGGYVKMAGEDPEQFELKPGQQVGFILNSENKITKIITSNFEKFPTSNVLEVAESDLEHKLTIKFLDEQEQAITYEVDPKASYFQDGSELQLAPFNRQFHSKTVAQRAMAIFAGPLMNFLLAIVIFLIIGLISGVPKGTAEFGKIVDNSPAEKFGLQSGDAVKSINGTEVSTWEELVLNIQKYPDQEATLIIERDGEVITKKMTIGTAKEDSSVGQIGVFPPFEKAPVRIVSNAFTETYEWTKRIFSMVGKLVTGQFSLKELSGPVGIYSTTEEVVKNGFTMLLSWTAVLSINLGIMNLLPLPALDGGRLLFLLLEAVRGKPVSREKEGMVHFVGFALLMILMLVVTWNDIQRVFFN